MTTVQALPVQLAEPIVDRSPELARGAAEGTQHIWGGTRIVLDASNGTRGDGGDCPLARGLIAHGCSEPRIQGEHATLIRNGKRVEITLGRAVIDWIGRFDRGENPPPLTIFINNL
jgi:hypothetical protein